MQKTSLLTSEESYFWNEKGFLLIKEALQTEKAAEIAYVLQDKFKDKAQVEASCGREFVGDAGNARDVCVLQAVTHAPFLKDLLDLPQLFKRVLGLMGPYIIITGVEVVIRYPHPNVLVKLHADGGPSLRTIFPSEIGKVLNLKAQVFLTDTLEESKGNFAVVPSSHRLPFPRDHKAIETAKIEPILAKAGDVVLFPWSLWHCVLPLEGEEPRVSVIIRYAQMWSRPADYRDSSDLPLTKLSARQRRLFGDFGKASGESAHPYDYYRYPPNDHLDLMFSDMFKDSEDYRFYEENHAFSQIFYKE